MDNFRRRISGKSKIAEAYPEAQAIIIGSNAGDYGRLRYETDSGDYIAIQNNVIQYFPGDSSLLQLSVDDTYNLRIEAKTTNNTGKCRVIGSVYVTLQNVNYVNSVTVIQVPTGYFSTTSEGIEYVNYNGLRWAWYYSPNNYVVRVGKVVGGGHSNYFSWADPSKSATYHWQLYKWGDGSNNNASGFSYDAHLTKYNSTDGLTTMQPADDPATVNVGSGWRTPTVNEVISGVYTTSRWQAKTYAVGNNYYSDYANVNALLNSDGELLMFGSGGGLGIANTYNNNVISNNYTDGARTYMWCNELSNNNTGYAKALEFYVPTSGYSSYLTMFQSTGLRYQGRAILAVHD